MIVPLPGFYVVQRPGGRDQRPWEGFVRNSHMWDLCFPTGSLILESRAVTAVPSISVMLHCGDAPFRSSHPWQEACDSSP